jgi:hypothetical protein
MRTFVFFNLVDLYLDSSFFTLGYMVEMKISEIEGKRPALLC